MKINTIYIENAAKSHPNTYDIIKRIKYKNIVYCNSYSEVFNSNNQNFRIQKESPSLILAYKKKNFILKAPEKFTIGFKNNYYFSHLLNCPYDCKYCFLQGMFNSANYVLFVNYEDFYSNIKKIAENNKEYSCFFSGYDSDSLALENVTNFLKEFIKYFEGIKKGVLEIRSKSINIKVFEKIKPLANVIPAFSLNPEHVVKEFEDKTPSLSKRLKAIIKLQNLGWSIGLRFDPLIYLKQKVGYEEFFNNVFELIDKNKIHSVTLGKFRMPDRYLKKISKVRPYNNLIQFENVKRMFPKLDQNDDKFQQTFLIKLLTKFIEREKIFVN